MPLAGNSIILSGYATVMLLEQCWVTRGISSKVNNDVQSSDLDMPMV